MIRLALFAAVGAFAFSNAAAQTVWPTTLMPRPPKSVTEGLLLLSRGCVEEAEAALGIDLNQPGDCRPLPIAESEVPRLLELGAVSAPVLWCNGLDGPDYDAIEARFVVNAKGQPWARGTETFAPAMVGLFAGTFIGIVFDPKGEECTPDQRLKARAELNAWIAADRLAASQ